MANTPFLDLVKPAGTDRALVSVINSNSDKIDTGVSTLSEHIDSTATWQKFSDLTLSNCQAHDNVGVKYAKYLGFVVLQIYVKSLTANSRVKIATLPTGYQPLKVFTYVGQGGSSYTTKAYFSVANNGDIYVISEDTYAQGYIIFWAA